MLLQYRGNSLVMVGSPVVPKRLNVFVLLGPRFASGFPVYSRMKSAPIAKMFFSGWDPLVQSGQAR
jgi:hypothetical protein